MVGILWLCYLFTVQSLCHIKTILVDSDTQEKSAILWMLVTAMSIGLSGQYPLLLTWFNFNPSMDK